MAGITFHPSSPEETMAIAEEFGKTLPLNSVLCFFGDLAAGKTTFIKGLVQGAASLRQEVVSSPTFVYLNVYKGDKTIYHFDLYRLGEDGEFLEMGFDEFFDIGGICCIEWSEKIASLLPQRRIEVHLGHEGENKRSIRIHDQVQ